VVLDGSESGGYEVVGVMAQAFNSESEIDIVRVRAVDSANRDSSGGSSSSFETRSLVEVLSAAVS